MNICAGAPCSICLASAELARVGDGRFLACLLLPLRVDCIERVLEARGGEHHDIATLRLHRCSGGPRAIASATALPSTQRISARLPTAIIAILLGFQMNGSSANTNTQSTGYIPSTIAGIVQARRRHCGGRHDASSHSCWCCSALIAAFGASRRRRAAAQEATRTIIDSAGRWSNTPSDIARACGRPARFDPSLYTRAGEDDRLGANAEGRGEAIPQGERARAARVRAPDRTRWARPTSRTWS